ncbi:MAG: hypothetical protein R2836_01390 [Chitinophagales bacterium]
MSIIKIWKSAGMPSMGTWYGHKTDHKENEIVDSNNVPMPKSEYYGYANENFSVTDNGSYFSVNGKQTSFGTNCFRIFW